MELSREDILRLEERFRRNLINSLLGPKSLVLAGTRSAMGQSNLAPFSQVFHVGANPPLAGLLFRPDSVARHTLSNIRETGFFTLQNVTRGFFREAHQCSARYPGDVSEFDATSLEEEYLDGFFAPFVKESTVKLGLQLNEEIKIASNNTILVVGEVLKCVVPDMAVEPDGFLNPQKTGSIASAGLDSYYTLQQLARLDYAKVNSK